MQEQKIKTLEQDNARMKQEISQITNFLSANTGKINLKKISIRRIESNLGIHQKDLVDLENFQRRNESKRFQLESQIKRNNSEISVLKRQNERSKITGQKY